MSNKILKLQVILFVDDFHANDEYLYELFIIKNEDVAKELVKKLNKFITNITKNKINQEDIKKDIQIILGEKFMNILFEEIPLNEFIDYAINLKKTFKKHTNKFFFFVEDEKPLPIFEFEPQTTIIEKENNEYVIYDDYGHGDAVFYGSYEQCCDYAIEKSNSGEFEYSYFYVTKNK